jgi:hypothetical protein
MKELNDFMIRQPHGFKCKFAKQNHISRAVLHNWQKQGIYYLHDGALYKKVRVLNHGK